MFRSFNERNMKSVGQRAAKLLAFKEYDSAPVQLELGLSGSTRVEAARQTLSWDLQLWKLVTYFETLWSTDPIFLAWKDLIRSLKCTKIQESNSIFRVGFALSKTPHLHRAYLVTVRKRKSMTVRTYRVNPLVRSPKVRFTLAKSYMIILRRLDNLSKTRVNLPCSLITLTISCC